MRYHIKEQAWRLAEPFVVTDEAGSAVFEARGAFATVDDDLVLLDVATGEELARAHFRQRLLSLALHFEIYRGGSLWGSMLDRLQLFREGFKVQTADGRALHITGDTFRWNFSVTDGAGHPLALIGHQYSVFPDCYAIEVSQDVDGIAIVALVIAIDIVRERREQEQASRGDEKAERTGAVALQQERTFHNDAAATQAS